MRYWCFGESSFENRVGMAGRKKRRQKKKKRKKKKKKKKLLPSPA